MTQTDRLLSSLKSRLALEQEAVVRMGFDRPSRWARSPNGAIIRQTAEAIERFMDNPTRFNWEAIRNRMVSPSMTAEEACRAFCSQLKDAPRGTGQPTPDSLAHSMREAAKADMNTLKARIEGIEREIGNADVTLMPAKKESVPALILG